MNQTRNPIRRNRNIGTAKQGHGQDNRLRIASRLSDDKVYYERLENPVIVERSLGKKTILFFVEPTHSGYLHSCTIEDVMWVLQNVEPDDWNLLDFVVFRQPKQKEDLLKPVWGRIAYFVELEGRLGTAIFLDAQNQHRSLRWSRSLDPEDAAEFQRLCDDGHRVEEDKRGFTLHLTLDSIRQTQLFRSFLHEIGHLVDRVEHLYKPLTETDDEQEQKYLTEKYDSKPRRDKETYAHRYASETFNRLKSMSLVPFERLVDLERMQFDKLAPEWFGIEPNSLGPKS
ncbi:MAG: hypothetical protein K1Y36_09640 [Blastocatellia bacterium]|nr:hypothetical protein [Blastocatellia bacterium]